ncbi:MAG: PIN domain-containing protein [Jaaginema sp. PMC 1080.18]|nr:PIN domain-containing protein [Jaaginema sp. PMC 1080.18]
MKLDEALEGVKRVFLDTAPVIYFVEEIPDFVEVVQVVIDKLIAGEIEAVISPVTFAECLVQPIKIKNTKLQKDFVDFLLAGEPIFMVDTDTEIGYQAAYLRAKYNLKLPDALQVATAIRSGCEALLTNDDQFRRVSELRVLMVEDFVEGDVA